MSGSFSSLPLTPLERLMVRDGFLLNAERWQQAHDYHRQRQNLHFQSLHQPGIVTGLGVSVVAAPNQIAAAYRDGRWLRIQPGLAIDGAGNPIVVPSAVDFRIAAELSDEPWLWVYLVVRYVDPEQLQYTTPPEIVTETFQIDEKTTPPTEFEVELCRILLRPGELKLEAAPNPLAPGTNQLDLRYRPQVQPRSPSQVSVTQIGATGNLSELLSATAALYPALQAWDLGPMVSGEAWDNNPPDLIYVSGTTGLMLPEPMLDRLRHWIANGTTILVEMGSPNAALQKLQGIRKELQAAIAQFQQGTDFAWQTELQTELAAVESTLHHKLNELLAPIRQWGDRLGIDTHTSGTVDRQHPLRRQPFLFGDWPLLEGMATEVWSWPGLMAVMGNGARIWQGDDLQGLSRETIRTVQEFGINLLHFAALRHRLTQLQQPATSSSVASETRGR